MLKNFIITAWRNLVKSKGYSIINIGGLAIGMAVALLIGLWILDELSYNKNHKHYNTVAQVLQHQHINNNIETYAALPLPLSTEIRNKYGSDFKQVAAAVTFEQFIGYNDKVFTRTGTFSEPGFPEIISLDMVAGSRTSINDPSSILLSESLAKNIFGTEDPLKKTVKLNNTFTYQVAGIYKDLPKNSRFHPVKFIASISARIKRGFINDNWQSHSFEIYTLLNNQVNPKQVSAKIKNVLYEKSGDASHPEIFLNPMSKWHLYEFRNGKQVGVKAQFVWLFGIIGVFVLILACINFMNLNTARSAKRAKEVGIRKTVGSLRRQLIFQFFSETSLVVFFAYVLAIFLVTITLPWFSELADKQLSIPFQQAGFWLASAVFIFITILLSGSYPALYLSSFKPVKVLKGTVQPGRLATIPRKMLVVLQFTVSVTLIIGTILVFRQIQYAQNRPVGYNRDRLLTIPLNNPEIATGYEAFKNELLNKGLAENISRSSSTTTGISSSANNLDWKGKDPDVQAEFGTILVDPEYGDAVQWTILSGRNFSNQYATDSFAFIFNEAAIKLMALEKPLGETVKWHGKNWHIIGVVKDMVMKSPFEKAMPTVFMMNDKERLFNIINIKLKATEAAGESVTKIEAAYKKYCPSSPFDYWFTEDAYNAKFSSEKRIGKLAAIFASLAVFISCLGLFSLASYMTGQRTKEIGVRKVLGASVFNLWNMLSKDFVVLVFISCAIAVPVAWYMLEQWLQKYEYRMEISWKVVALAVGGALLITLITVSFQTIKAALANPVKSLRSE